MKYTFLIAALLSSAAAMAITKPKVYLNPGHGGWGPNDRPLPTMPYPMTAETGRPDTCGFYESNTNLWKIAELGNILKSTGEYSVKYSRKANGPYPWVSGASNETRYDRVLSVISAEVDSWRADYFISVHSNAAADGALANYPLFLYRGLDTQNAVAHSREMCEKMWPFHTEAMKAGFEYQTAYFGTNYNIRGDRDFYHYTWQNDKGYYGYLGVLMHGCPGYLIEGYFHTYQPSRHRALNPDWCGMEGRRYSRGIIDYFGTTADTKGCIMGEVRTKGKTSDGLQYYAYSSDTNDKYLPLNGAHIRLKDSEGYLVGEYDVDNNYNGIFVFRDLDPGIYYLDFYCPGYKTVQVKSTSNKCVVTANKTTHKSFFMTIGATTDLKPAEWRGTGINDVHTEEPVIADRQTVRVFDAEGRLVTTTDRRSLETTSLPAGIYMVESNGKTTKYLRK